MGPEDSVRGEGGAGALGRETSGPIGAGELDTVPWNHPAADAVVEFSTDELTAFCPVTGQPDFYALTLSYRPAERLLESKALKLYLWGFRDKGAFAEDLAATMLASTLGIEFDPDAAWNERKRVYEMSDLIIDSLSLTAAAEGDAAGRWTCAVAVAVFRFTRLGGPAA